MEESIIISTSEPQEVFTFGCWNNKYAGDGDFQPLISVVANLGLKIRRGDDTQSLIILGDNYYEKKNKSEKKISPIEGPDIKKDKPKEKSKEGEGKKKDKKDINLIEEDLMHGFRLINTISSSLKKYLIMGNHDIKSNEDKKCVILDKEFDICDPGHGIVNNCHIMFPYNHQIREINSKMYLFIFIDTSIYDIKVFNCYKNTVVGQEIESSLAQSDLSTIKTPDKEIIEHQEKIRRFIDRQEGYLWNIIEGNDTINDIFVFGHEPLYTYKHKLKRNDENTKLELMTKIGVMRNIINILTSHIVNGKNINYVCADYHVCEYGILKNKSNNNIIKQYIFGSGGTGLDDVYSEVEKKYDDKDNQLEYYILNGPHKNFGYGQIILREEGAEINFIRVPTPELRINFSNIPIPMPILMPIPMPSPSQIPIVEPASDHTGGYYQKYKKYKSKYLELQKMLKK